MIIPKMLINSVATTLTKHFKLDKVMSYVFDDNELDKKVKYLEEKVKLLEKLSHAPREFVICNNCQSKIKEK
jgi:hypothetical protein